VCGSSCFINAHSRRGWLVVSEKFFSFIRKMPRHFRYCYVVAVDAAVVAVVASDLSEQNCGRMFKIDFNFYIFRFSNALQSWTKSEKFELKQSLQLLPPLLLFPLLRGYFPLEFECFLFCWCFYGVFITTIKTSSKFLWTLLNTNWNTMILRAYKVQNEN